jgi:restriction system protein
VTDRVAALRKDDFYLPTLQVLDELGGSASIEEIEEKLIERFRFTQEELDRTYDVSGDNIVTDKMSWARSYLKFPNFVRSGDTKGVWVLTEAGREATRDGAPAIDLIDGEALTELLKSLKLGVRVEPILTERITVDETFFDEI